MITHRKTTVGTGAILDIELGMVPSLITITNTVKRTQLVVLSNNGTIGSAIAIAASGARSNGAATISFLDADGVKGITLSASAGVNISGDTLIIDYSKLD